MFRKYNGMTGPHVEVLFLTTIKSYRIHLVVKEKLRHVQVQPADSM